MERLRARANRGASLTAWIRAVLLHHTAYLMAAPGVLPILASLSQVPLPQQICPHVHGRAVGICCAAYQKGFIWRRVISLSNLHWKIALCMLKLVLICSYAHMWSYEGSLVLTNEAP